VTTDLSLAPDPELVNAARKGSEPAFEILVGRHQRGIVNYIYRMAGNYETALELAQETFLKVYLSLADYNTQYKFSTWIYRIAHNVTIDLLRKKIPRSIPIDAPVETEDGPKSRQFESGEQSALETMVEDEEWERIGRAIAALPGALRELIILRHVNLRSYQEIARITGLPLGTVKNRIFLGRAELRKLLGAPLRPEDMADEPVKKKPAEKKAAPVPLPKGATRLSRGAGSTSPPEEKKSESISRGAFDESTDMQEKRVKARRTAASSPRH
jgi:RNA polymerase sigma-70 factor (ECF subfamily)